MTTALATRHRTDQSRLVALMLDELRAAWDGPVPPSDEVLIAMVQDYGRASTHLAAGYYGEERALAGAPGRFTTPLAEPAPAEQITRSMGWATRPLRLPEPNPAAAAVQVDGVARRLVANAGRATVLGAGQADRVAVRYARVTAPTACAFCALIATRGAVYLSRGSARGSRPSGYHDHCACSVEAVFPRQDWTPPEHVQAFDRLYTESTAGTHGTETLRAFRRAVADRRRS